LSACSLARWLVWSGCSVACQFAVGLSGFVGFAFVIGCQFARWSLSARLLGQFAVVGCSLVTVAVVAGSLGLSSVVIARHWVTGLLHWSVCFVWLLTGCHYCLSVIVALLCLVCLLYCSLLVRHWLCFVVIVGSLSLLLGFVCHCCSSVWFRRFAWFSVGFQVARHCWFVTGFVIAGFARWLVGSLARSVAVHHRSSHCWLVCHCSSLVSLVVAGFRRCQFGLPVSWLSVGSFRSSRHCQLACSSFARFAGFARLLVCSVARHFVGLSLSLARHCHFGCLVGFVIGSVGWFVIVIAARLSLLLGCHCRLVWLVGLSLSFCSSCWLSLSLLLLVAVVVVVVVVAACSLRRPARIVRSVVVLSNG
jgi:hypothetical protein